ncbi:hypothetical protein SGPA1_21697 [Streptomyces misionensis JCM 4497]
MNTFVGRALRRSVVGNGASDEAAVLDTRPGPGRPFRARRWARRPAQGAADRRRRGARCGIAAPGHRVAARAVRARSAGTGQAGDQPQRPPHARVGPHVADRRRGHALPGERHPGPAARTRGGELPFAARTVILPRPRRDGRLTRPGAAAALPRCPAAAGTAAVPRHRHHRRGGARRAGRTGVLRRDAPAVPEGTRQQRLRVPHRPLRRRAGRPARRPRPAAPHPARRRRTAHPDRRLRRGSRTVRR